MRRGGGRRLDRRPRKLRRPRAHRRCGAVRRAGFHRRARAPRVVEAPGGRVRTARAAARDDDRRRRPPRDRKRARHRRRALAPRRNRGDAARRPLHGVVMRAGVEVRVPPPGAQRGRPRGAPAAPAGGRPGRDDELPRSDRGRSGRARQARARGRRAGRRARAGRARGRASGLRRGRHRLRPRVDHHRGGPRAPALRHVAPDPRGDRRSQPACADPTGGSTARIGSRSAPTTATRSTSPPTGT